MGRSVPIEDEATLRHLYEVERLPCHEIAKRLGVSEVTVRRWFRHYGIQGRPGGSHLERPTRDVLVRMYTEERCSIAGIAEQLGVGTHAVFGWLSQYNIETRAPWEQSTLQSPATTILTDLYVTQRLSIAETAERLGVSAPVVSRWLSDCGIQTRPLGFPNPDRAVLCTLYVKEALSLAEIGDRFGVSGPTVSRWLHEAGIDTRDRGGQNVIQQPDCAVLCSYYEGELMTTIEIAHIFDTYDKIVGDWLKRCGVPLRPPGSQGRVYRCSDGHLVRSGMERMVDNWMTDQGIQHVYEPRVPGDIYKADFLARGHYIEVWGLADSGFERYAEDQQAKLAYYQSRGLSLIQIPGETFRSGDWQAILHQHLLVDA